MFLSPYKAWTTILKIQIIGDEEYRTKISAEKI